MCKIASDGNLGYLPAKPLCHYLTLWPSEAALSLFTNILATARINGWVKLMIKFSVCNKKKGYGWSCKHFSIHQCIFPTVAQIV